MIHLLFPKSKEKSAIVNTASNEILHHSQDQSELCDTMMGMQKNSHPGQATCICLFFKLSALNWNTNLFYITGNLKLCVGVRS